MRLFCSVSDKWRQIINTYNECEEVFSIVKFIILHIKCCSEWAIGGSMGTNTSDHMKHCNSSGPHLHQSFITVRISHLKSSLHVI